MVTSYNCILHACRLSETDQPKQEFSKLAMMIGLEAVILDEIGPLTRSQHATIGKAFTKMQKNG